MSDPKRILIVDDEEHNLDLLEALLESLGHESESALNGFEALSKLDPSIDLVLLDVMMPYMDGFEVTRRIRHDPLCYDIPVIMVTGLSSKEDRLAAVEAGANDFITKPIEKVELGVRIASLLKMKEVQDAIKHHKAELEATISQRTADLQDSEKRYRTLFQESLDAILIVDANYRIVDVNPAFLNLFGFSREDTRMLNPRELFVDPADAARFHHEILRQGFVGDRVWKIRTKDGSERECVFTASPRRETDGRFIGYQSIVHDVTDRKRAEEALRESEEKYRLLVDNANEGIILCRNGRPTFVNGKAVEIMGHSEEELSTIPFTEFVHQDDREAVIHSLQNARSAETVPERLSFRIVAEDGATRWLAMKTVLVDWHRVPASLSFLEDVTTRKQAQDALRESESRFRAIFEAARDIIFIKDRDLVYRHANSAFLTALDSPMEKLLGMTDEDIFGPPVAHDLQQVEERVLEGHTVETERTLSLAGRPVTLSCLRVPLRDATGQVKGVCGIARDVTDRKPGLEQPQLPVNDYRSEAMRVALEKAMLAAQTDSIVLLVGEKGCGKDYVARYVHDHSRRRGGPFLKMQCGALGSDLAAVELFGQGTDSISAARGRKRGLVELAEGGTLLLNEIGRLTHDLQTRLVSFLDTRTFTPVGSDTGMSVNTRIVASTSTDLEKEIEDGSFRKDLYYLLDVFPIHVPPLRQRLEDLPLLVNHLLVMLTRELGLSAVPTVDPGAMEVLADYRWPGNVRELRNVLERALILCDSQTVTAQHVVIDVSRDT